MAQSWFVVPMAFGRDRVTPVPDREGARRCERAFRIAKRIGDRRDSVWIVLGAGMPHRYHEPFDEQTLSDLSERWLIDRGWEPLQIIKNPKGCNTRTELLAVQEAIERRGEANVHVRLVTSFWHAPRVWLVALLVFHRPIRVSMARTTMSPTVLARELLKEAVKLPCEILRTVPMFERLTERRYDPHYE